MSRAAACETAGKHRFSAGQFRQVRGHIAVDSAFDRREYGVRRTPSVPLPLDSSVPCSSVVALDPPMRSQLLAAKSATRACFPSRCFGRMGDFCSSKAPSAACALGHATHSCTRWGQSPHVPPLHYLRSCMFSAVHRVRDEGGPCNLTRSSEQHASATHRADMLGVLTHLVASERGRV